jgi:RNA polymerase sigma-70 factor, ECF subfamily
MTLILDPGVTVDIAATFQAQRDRLFGLAYRLTGSSEDAEDVVQQAFERLLAQPAGRVREDVGPWLVRVVTNLGIDALRRRRKAPYPGTWLPFVLEDVATSADDAEARYGRSESATFAFLVALEALTPRQRAVLLLRDVLGHTAEEAAAVLDTSEGSVRILHLRARRALAEYDRCRCVPTPALRERHRVALEQFLACLAGGDAGRLEAMLAEGVRTTTDHGGEYRALKAPLAGRAQVGRFYLTAAESRRAGGLTIEIRVVNGVPAALVTLTHPVRRQAPRTLMFCELDEAGKIARMHTLLSSRKLAGLRP